YFWCDFLTDLPKPDYPHVKQAFERVGARSPARNTVRQWVKAVEGTSAEARQALREISNSSEKSV
ncbi:unnamed protein product, partial [Pylaiella littoralis]